MCLLPSQQLLVLQTERVFCGYWCFFALKTHWPKPKEIKVETFRIDYLIRTPKVEKLSLQPIRSSAAETPANRQVSEQPGWCPNCKEASTTPSPPPPPPCGTHSKQKTPPNIYSVFFCYWCFSCCCCEGGGGGAQQKLTPRPAPAAKTNTPSGTPHARRQQKPKKRPLAATKTHQQRHSYLLQTCCKREQGLALLTLQFLGL